MLDLRTDRELWRFLIPTTDKPTYFINELRRFIRHFPLPADQTGTAMKIADRKRHVLIATPLLSSKRVTC